MAIFCFRREKKQEIGGQNNIEEPFLVNGSGDAGEKKGGAMADLIAAMGHLSWDAKADLIAAMGHLPFLAFVFLSGEEISNRKGLLLIGIDVLADIVQLAANCQHAKEYKKISEHGFEVRSSGAGKNKEVSRKEFVLIFIASTLVSSAAMTGAVGLFYYEDFKAKIYENLVMTSFSILSLCFGLMPFRSDVLAKNTILFNKLDAAIWHLGYTGLSGFNMSVVVHLYAYGDLSGIFMHFILSERVIAALKKSCGIDLTAALWAVRIIAVNGFQEYIESGKKVIGQGWDSCGDKFLKRLGVNTLVPAVMFFLFGLAHRYYRDNSKNNERTHKENVWAMFIFILSATLLQVLAPVVQEGFADMLDVTEESISTCLGGVKAG